MNARYPFLDAPTPLAFAHRGGAAEGDENTVEAFGRAIDLGYRYVETDVQATSDGVAVVFHDDTLHRIFGRDARVDELRYADLASIRVDGDPVVPRLDAVLAAWPEVRFNIDVKCDAAVAPVVDVVRRAGALDRVLLAAFSDARTARLRAELGPELATSLGHRGAGLLYAASRVGWGAARTGRRVAAAQVPPTSGRLRVVDRRFVRHAHRLGLQVHVWTIDDPAEMHELLDLGVDGIMTDHIDVLRDVYTQRGHWPA
ncbi:glycerophosphodiester phosphodiesterase family protein [Rugosimonospora africana]|uniref:glycerophosphodiester phosphodiesterase family protein n=1 Tax=Rugosimonospora africana TaxID=556532 RepID=UPI00194469E2|nr:glycerophosphodiester phosphodiesterase family protein [Rugosimonospora africana]